MAGETLDRVPKSEVESRLLELVEAESVARGFRVVDLDCRIGGRGLVRIFIERNDDKHSPPTLDECAALSPIFGEILEKSEFCSVPYDLEVSSPGLDRRLRLFPDFERAVGSQVKLKLFERLESRGANFTGTLEKAETESGRLFLKVGREVVQIPVGKVKQANLVWSPSQP